MICKQIVCCEHYFLTIQAIFVFIKLYGCKYSYITLIIILNINHLVAHRKNILRISI